MKKLLAAVTVLAVSTAQAATIYVDASCPGGDGSELDPFCSIQTAIDNAVDTDEIIVAEGIYFEDINFMGKAITVRSMDPSDPMVVANTVIDGTGNFHVVQCVNAEGPDTVLDGFTITGGNANGASPDNTGGGMYNDASSPTVTNCVFSGNTAVAGGGMYNDGSSPTVTNCTFSGNTATIFGGNGGGMYNGFGSSPTVTGCTFSGNLAVGFGNGGGMYNTGASSPTVTNCTFTGNVAGGEGGMHNTGGSNPMVTNCILWNNGPEEIFGTATVAYSDVHGGWPGIGNIDADPVFVDPDIGDLRLAPGSPCIDAGDNTAVPLDVVEDLDGNPRFEDAVYYPDTGNGDPPIVDMGAYEADPFTPSPPGTTHDILWRHDNGQTFIWLLDGTQRIGQGSPGSVGKVWQIAGVGDFDGDGHGDILWRHQNSGQIVVWYINGTQFDGFGPVGGVSLDWTVEGIANFDGMGGDDILWRHTSGLTYIWLMNGTTVVGQGSPGSVGQVWQIAGVGDFDGDGNADILWWNTSTGQVFIWFMEGAQRVASGPAGSADPNVWEIAGVGDFDGLASTPTPTADILWRRNNGQTFIWLMDGTVRIGQGSPGSVGQVWQIAGVGDFDGDRRADILWRLQSASGQVFVWFIEGTERVGHGSLGGVSHVWQIERTADFDGE